VSWRRPRLSLLGKFGLVSVVPIGVLGVVLAVQLGAHVRRDALANARQSAALVADLGIQPQLEGRDLGVPLDPALIASLDRQFRSASVSSRIARIKIWNREGTIVYSDDPALIGANPPASDELHLALNGAISSEVSDLEQAEEASERSFGTLLEVYVPLRLGADPQPAGAFEIYVPYAPIAAMIDNRTRELYLLLFGGLLLLYVALFRIVAGASTRLRRQAEENRHQALHDPLTGLPNRTLFRERLREALEAARDEGRSVAVMILDLDRFKEINDTLGHHCGDELLQRVGTRMRGVLRESDVIARLGGDEFGALLVGPADPVEGSRAAAERIHRALAHPFALEALTLEVEGSIGVAVYPEHAEDADTLIQHADVALYVAKEAHTSIEVYAPERDRHSPARLALLGELRRAIDASDLILYYQPEIEPATGRVVSVEALLRWRHPERGLVMPDEFIPLAERTGLMKPLTLYVLNAALAQCHAWRREGHDLHVAVNLSARNIHDLSLPDDVERLLRKWRVPADRLELELTESAILSDPLRADEVLTRLSGTGVRIAIDDFGTGYSSLAHLRRLPVDKIKIDRSFVRHILTDENDRVIVGSIIELGRSLGLEVVAEGVETDELWARLSALGCRVAQGYFLSQPLPAADLLPWLSGLTALSSEDVRAMTGRRGAPA
jgi:diguanylate cyclase (GGDEF)-like protein